MVEKTTLAFAEALAESRGSAKEYQHLLRELESFDQAYLQMSRERRRMQMLTKPGNRVMAVSQRQARVGRMWNPREASIQCWGDVLLDFRLRRPSE